VDGRDVSVELLKAGLATHYKQYNSDWLLAALEQQAKADRVGMWASLAKAPQVEGSPALPAGAASNAAAMGRTSQIVYHGNTTSRIFHSPSCRNYNCKNCTLEYRSREEAMAAGFRPCGGCRP
jgi:micrococcal nuclease